MSNSIAQELSKPSFVFIIESRKSRIFNIHLSKTSIHFKRTVVKFIDKLVMSGYHFLNFRSSWIVLIHKFNECESNIFMLLLHRIIIFFRPMLHALLRLVERFITIFLSNLVLILINLLLIKTSIEFIPI